MSPLKGLLRSTIAAPILFLKDVKKAKKEGKTLGQSLKKATHKHFSDVQENPVLAFVPQAAAVVKPIAGTIAKATADDEAGAVSAQDVTDLGAALSQLDALLTASNTGTDLTA